jgi:hypothetical protein
MKAQEEGIITKGRHFDPLSSGEYVAITRHNIFGGNSGYTHVSSSFRPNLEITASCELGYWEKMSRIYNPRIVALIHFASRIYRQNLPRQEFTSYFSDLGF